MTFLLGAAAKAAAAAPAAAAPAKGAPLTVQQAIPQTAAPQTFLQMHASWLTHGIAGIFVIAAIALVALLAVQTTKQEGLSGTIGGRVESAYGRMGAEEQLKRITGFTAVVFVVTGFILSLTGI
ncbi:MAG TPA: preprotein translocase subunit SecG [Candidatus Acidoferrum sp.]|nr:preprotein translocase subunit SecG [Candidatus Acidoferrum sp.]